MNHFIPDGKKKKKSNRSILLNVNSSDDEIEETPDPVDSDDLDIISEAIQSVIERIKLGREQEVNNSPNPAALLAKVKGKYHFIRVYRSIELCNNEIKNGNVSMRYYLNSFDKKVFVDYYYDRKPIIFRIFELFKSGVKKAKPGTPIDCSKTICYCVNITNPNFEESNSTQGQSSDYNLNQ